MAFKVYVHDVGQQMSHWTQYQVMLDIGSSKQYRPLSDEWNGKRH